MLKIFGTKVIKDRFYNKEANTSIMLPYEWYWDSNTLCVNNGLLQVIKINGFPFETADNQDLDIRKNLRNSLFKNISVGNVTLYFHLFRKCRPITSLNPEYAVDPTVKKNDDFVSHLSNEWKKKHSSIQSFFNELYISVLWQPDKTGAAFIQYLYKKLKASTDTQEWENSRKDMADNLTEISSRILNTFHDYGAELLGVEEASSGAYCSILEFLGTIVNCGYSAPMLVPRGKISNYIPTHRLFFGDKAIEARGPGGEVRYGGIVSVQEYSPYTSTGMFDPFLQMPFEFIMTQSFAFANRSIAIGKMQLQQNRMIQMKNEAVSQIAEISRALDMAMSGEIAFGEHHLTVLCLAQDLKQLEYNLSVAAVELSNCGVKAVREKPNLEACFWAQLPGNNDYIARKSIVNTLNLASFASMHNFSMGKAKGNHWGEYVTILNTTSGTPYYFNFHVQDVGHTLIIGPTGAGKTVLMNFLCAQAQKFKPRMYFFDKDRGAEIFIRALGGTYTIINPGVKCNFNPLLLPDTGENRTFLLEWLKLLVTVNKELISAEDIALLTMAIDGNYRLHSKDRKLSNIVPFLGIGGPGTLANRIAMWHGYGSHAKVFDNDIDSIDLTKARVFGFEMAELLQDPISLSPTLLYIFHRINLSLTGYPTMIVLDEAWALIDNEVFAPKIRDWLKVLRKLNTFVIFATQSVEDAAKSRISDTLIQQTATQIFLPNLKATEVYKTNFMLSNREYFLIKSTDPASRYFLIKQGIQAVIAKVDLHGMDDIVSVLSGRTDTVLMMTEIIQKYGSIPEKWLPIFYQKVKAKT